MAELRPPKHANGDRNGMPVITEHVPRFCTIRRRYSMPAAHFLPKVHTNHKCFNIHGHNWKFEIALRGPVDPEKGWVVDFRLLDNLFEGEVRRPLDHRLLNETIPNPTSENVAQWVWDVFVRRTGQLMDGGSFPPGSEIVSITVWEEDDAGVTYEGPGG